MIYTLPISSAMMTKAQRRARFERRKRKHARDLRQRGHAVDMEHVGQYTPTDAQPLEFATVEAGKVLAA